MGLRLRWWCRRWKWRRKTAIPTHKHPTQFVFCAIRVVFVLEIVWIEKFVGIVWIEKFVSWFWKDGEDGLSSNWWWYEDGGIVYQKKKKMVGLSFGQWWYEWWYSLPKKEKEKKDGGMKMEEWSSSHWWREPLQVVSKGALVWCCSDSGSHVCVFNYQNAMKTQFW